MKKQINQEYFDILNKEKYYVIGTFFGSYVPSYNNKGIIFRSRHFDLVSSIKEKLESDHKITSDNRKFSYWFEVRNCPYIVNRLNDLEINPDKEKRLFPTYIPNENLSDFIRGFFDSKAENHSHIKNTENNYLRIGFNKEFLKELNNNLIKHTGVRKKYNQNSSILNYFHDDSIKIHDFIYRDFEDIKTKGIYLQEKKEMFNTLHLDPRKNKKNEIDLKLRKAKSLLALPDYNVKRVSYLLGYKDVRGLIALFEREEGISPKQYQMQIKDSVFVTSLVQTA